MNLGIIVGMASITVGGAIVEKILTGMGKVDEAQMLSMGVKTIVISTVIGCIATVLNQVRKLG